MANTAQDLIDRAAKYDPALAADIRAFAKSREYGLVFEHNRPEQMRLYGKPISVGDAVHVLAPRGKKETANNRITWRVKSIADDIATIVKKEDKAIEDTQPVSELVAIAEYDEPIYAGLRETGRIERGGDKPYQVVINGENYHALESLLFCYAGKVDCIYIDPPYNTGAKDWKYNNDYVDGSDQYRHSKWLAMMERRLLLAKQLLNPANSVLICTIDEKEYLRLGLLLEQIFSGTTIQMVTTMINKKAATRQQEFSRAEEYIFFVMIGDAHPGTARMNMMTGDYNLDKKPISYEGLRRRGGKRRESPGCFYPLFINEDDSSLHSVGEPIPLNEDRNTVDAPSGTWAAWPINADGTESRWQIERGRFLEQLNNSTLVLGSVERDRESATVLYLKRADLHKIESGEVIVTGKDEQGRLVAEWAPESEVDNSPKSIWVMNSHDASVYGTTLHKKFIPESSFDFPKSLYAVEDTIRFFVGEKSDALVLDFFSGSGTTAHAVMRLNHQDQGRRRCICVTNNEVSDSDAKDFRKRNLRKGDVEWEAAGICSSITTPRLKAAITGLRPDGIPVKGNYGIKVKRLIEDDEIAAMSRKTGKELTNRRVWVQKEMQDHSVPDAFPMADGFEENAVFYDLTYLDPNVVSLGVAFEEIAPLLWLRAGSKGGVIASEDEKGYAFAETYAVLFDYAHAKEFFQEAEKHTTVKTIFVVTDDESRYESACRALKGLDVVRLYESYLRSFRIAAEGAVS